MGGEEKANSGEGKKERAQERGVVQRGHCVESSEKNGWKKRLEEEVYRDLVITVNAGRGKKVKGI